MTMTDKPQANAEYYFKEGCYIQEFHNTPEDPAMSIARARVQPGVRTRLHALSETSERYAVLSGHGMITVAGRSWKVAAGEVVVIDPGQPHCIENTGGEDLVFLAICTPRFDERNYRDLGE